MSKNQFSWLPCAFYNPHVPAGPGEWVGALRKPVNRKKSGNIIKGEKLRPFPPIIKIPYKPFSCPFPPSPLKNKAICCLVKKQEMENKLKKTEHLSNMLSHPKGLFNLTLTELNFIEYFTDIDCLNWKRLRYYELSSFPNYLIRIKLALATYKAICSLHISICCVIWL